MKTLKKQNIFTIITKFLVIILPFYVIIKVFFEYKLGIPKFGFFIKEFLIILLIASLIYEYYKQKKIPKIELIDYLIIFYFAYGILITLINGLGIKSILYGGRYDFILFLIFLIYKHGYIFLKIRTKQLLTLFVYSASISLFLSIFVKFRIGEDILLLFGFTDYISDWTYNGSIPTYHGLENSGIRRFSGILESPNAMGFFLILYSSIFLFLQKKKQEFYVFFMMSFLFILLILTYSRSAILGIFVAIGILFLFNIKYIYKNFKKILIIGILGIFFLGGIFGLLFQDNIKNIVLRTSSTKGHFNRMNIGIKRFANKPFGSGLGEAGPAYRSTHSDLKPSKEVEEYYIPESWFIQQLIEGGIIYFLLFISILGVIIKKLFKTSYVIFGLFIAILVMNLFLHVFEATYLSILLFMFIGLFYEHAG